MFEPPRCPYESCAMHDAPTPDFYTRFGTYRPKCRSQPVPRFRCRGCKRTFSRQTFQMDYRDHKPHANRAVFGLLVLGAGIRQTARIVGMHRESVAKKARKIGRHCVFSDHDASSRTRTRLPGPRQGRVAVRWPRARA
jgi:transposase-like protein